MAKSRADPRCEMGWCLISLTLLTWCSHFGPAGTQTALICRADNTIAAITLLTQIAKDHKINCYQSESMMGLMGEDAHVYVDKSYFVILDFIVRFL